MTGARLTVVILLAAGIAVPLLLPLFELFRSPAWSIGSGESHRLSVLAFNTFALAVGAVLLTLPAGAAAAVALERGRVPGAVVLRVVVAVGLFIPLPVYAAGWQAVA